MKLVNISEAAYAQSDSCRAPCPECDRGPRDDAVSVTVRAICNFVWLCHRCGSAGASGRNTYRAQVPRYLIRENQHDGLAPRALALWKSTHSLGGKATGFLVHELEAVITARATGADDDAIRKLVKDLVAARSAAKVA